jgi:hypothetical protein
MMGPGKDPTSRELAVKLNINKNTACFLIMRIRNTREKNFALYHKIAEEVRRRLR